MELFLGFQIVPIKILEFAAVVDGEFVATSDLRCFWRQQILEDGLVIFDLVGIVLPEHGIITELLTSQFLESFVAYFKAF